MTRIAFDLDVVDGSVVLDRVELRGVPALVSLFDGEAKIAEINFSGNEPGNFYHLRIPISHFIRAEIRIPR